MMIMMIMMMIMIILIMMLSHGVIVVTIASWKQPFLETS